MSIGLMKRIIGMLMAAAGLFLFGLTGWSLIENKVEI